jgi:hypothetical protein
MTPAGRLRDSEGASMAPAVYIGSAAHHYPLCPISNAHGNSSPIREVEPIVPRPTSTWSSHRQRLRTCGTDPMLHQRKDCQYYVPR